MTAFGMTSDLLKYPSIKRRSGWATGEGDREEPRSEADCSMIRSPPDASAIDFVGGVRSFLAAPEDSQSRTSQGEPRPIPIISMKKTRYDNMCLERFYRIYEKSIFLTVFIQIQNLYLESAWTILVWSA